MRTILLRYTLFTAMLVGIASAFGGCTDDADEHTDIGIDASVDLAKEDLVKPNVDGGEHD